MFYRHDEGEEYTDFSARSGQIIVDFNRFTTSSDRPYDLYLFVYNSSGEGFSQSLPLAESTTPFQLVYNLDSATVDLSAVSSVQLSASAAPSGEFAIGRISFVPEPTSVATLVFSLFGVLAVLRTHAKRD